MKHENCTHPPFVVHSEKAPRERLEDIAEQLAHQPLVPIVSDLDLLVLPVECSWCRKPHEAPRRRWFR